MTGPTGTARTSPRRRSILHVDMDAFYVAVETLVDPSLKGKPVIVGGAGARGVVASCSYEARAFGVRSAMASLRARQLCPQAIFLRGNHALYGEYSELIHEVLRSFTPHIEPIALDEAFLDLTGAKRLFGSGAQAAVSIREAVLAQTNLTCSVGVAHNKLLAKLASKEAKPPIVATNQARIEPTATVARTIPGSRRSGPGVLEVIFGEELVFLAQLPVRALWGVGPKTFERLQRFGVWTIADLAALRVETLTRALGESAGRHLHSLANGIDDRPVESDRSAKSIGHEETFAEDHFDAAFLETELVRMSDAVSSRMRQAGVRGRTVQLKLKTADFRILTRSRTLRQAIDTARPMREIAQALLHAPDIRSEITDVGVRLIGVSMSNLALRETDQAPWVLPDPDLREAVAQQLDFFSIDPGSSGATAHHSDSDDSPGVGIETASDVALAGTVDAIRARFGQQAVGSAALAGRKGLRVKVNGDTQWGPSGSESDDVRSKDF